MKEEFVSAINSLSKAHEVLVIVDEVQTGLARTGSLYAHQLVGLEPDIITLSKPLAAGLPLSATLIPEKVDSLLHVGEHGTTFGGGPVTTAVALEVWKTLSDAGFIRPLATRGIVGQVTPSTIAYDAETTRGGSGGPVLSLDGEVVAVTFAILAEFGGSNLGVPVEEVRRLLAEAAELSDRDEP